MATITFSKEMVWLQFEGDYSNQNFTAAMQGLVDLENRNSRYCSYTIIPSACVHHVDNNIITILYSYPKSSLH